MPRALPSNRFILNYLRSQGPDQPSVQVFDKNPQKPDEFEATISITAVCIGCVKPNAVVVKLAAGGICLAPPGGDPDQILI
jgi:hypothetical protein